MLRLIGFIPGGFEEIVAFVFCEEVADIADSLPQFIIGPGSGSSDQGLQFGEGHFDGGEGRPGIDPVDQFSPERA